MYRRHRAQAARGERETIADLATDRVRKSAIDIRDGHRETFGMGDRNSRKAPCRQLRLAYLAPEVLKRLTCGREASAVSLYDLCFLAGEDGGGSRWSGR
jgi:hypothetical protein